VEDAVRVRFFLPPSDLTGVAAGTDSEIPTPADVVFSVEVYSATETGGKSGATINATGSRESIAQLLDYIAQGVKIYDDSGDQVWWGTVTEVSAVLGRWAAGVSLDGMANSIATAYTTTDPNATASASSRGTTAYQEDALSIQDYGRLQLMKTLTNTTKAAAEAHVARELAIRSVPMPVWERVPAAAEDGSDDRASATIECAGWQYRLSRRYYSAPALQSTNERSKEDPRLAIDPGKAQYRYVTGTTEIVEDITVNLGCVTTTTNQAQKGYFTWVAPNVGPYAMPLAVRSMSLKMAKIGTPTDTWNVVLTTDEAATKVVATLTFNSATLNTGHAWTKLTLPTGGIDGILPGVTYYAHISRTGALSDTNYVRLTATTALSNASSIFRVWNGTAWVVTTGGDRDLMYEIELQPNDLTVDVGAVAARERTYQTYVPPVAGDASVGEVRIELSKIGAPADNVLIDLCRMDGIGGTPGTVLHTLTVSATVMTSAAREIVFTPTAWPANTNMAHALVVRRSGALDPVNYVRVHVKSTTNATITLATLNGSTWTTRTDQDAVFKVMFVHETTRQIVDLIASVGVPYIRGVLLESSAISGIYTSPFQSGDRDALTILNALISIGTSTGKRLLWEITSGRLLRIFTEPNVEQVNYYMHDDGSLQLPSGGETEKSRCPVAVWIKLHGNVPQAISSSRILRSSVQFVKRAEYRPASDEYTFTPRGLDDLISSIRVQVG
jgi:hypothetical protein